MFKYRVIIHLYLLRKNQDFQEKMNFHKVLSVIPIFTVGFQISYYLIAFVLKFLLAIPNYHVNWLILDLIINMLSFLISS